MSGTGVAELAEIPAGPALATALAQLDRSILDSDELVEMLIAQQRQCSHEQSRLLADIAAVAAAVPVREFRDLEVAAALTWTRMAASHHVDLAEQVVHRLPALHNALSDGLVDLPKARTIADAVRALDVADARAVVDQILPIAPGLTTGQLRPKIAKLAITVDPDAAARRREQRIRDRRIQLGAEQDGTASLFGLDLPAERAVAAANRLIDLARTAKAAGDTRSMDQLRADTFLDLLDGTYASAAGGRGGGVELVVPIGALAGATDQPGTLTGYGPVLADIARQVAAAQHDTTWRYSVYDPATGRVLHHGTTRRRPTADIHREVVTRDRTCRAPGCRVPARNADLDHTTDWATGGETTPANLGVLCRTHHRAKHEGGWQLRQPQPGHFVWTSPLRRTYHVQPEPP